MTPDELNDFLSRAFPGFALPMSVVRSTAEEVEVIQPFDTRQIRPGGTISGPTLMTLADTTAYVAVVAGMGPEFLAVTSHLAIDFLRKPPPAGLRAVGTVIKRGRRQALVVVQIRSEQGDELVAHSTVTYALPSVPTI
jgi:uncharacterized protein (TIGR00369 family)